MNKGEISEDTDLHEVYEFLDELRDTGKINMFGAGPYLQEEYAVGRWEAAALVKKWMNRDKEHLKILGEGND